ncbi:MAG: DUF559 domain-containing protein [Ruminococcaceae bacterium]|nr:DUF559 domain-containing protein [Oscillospiraceae bacterium]
MRTKATRQENHLWYDFLKNYPIQFRRQVMIDHFIADFYCHKAKLIIEVDGSQHETDEGMRKDELRTEILEGYGLKVIRVSNKSVDREFDMVCKYIDQIVQDSMGGV